MFINRVGFSLLAFTVFFFTYSISVAIRYSTVEISNLPRVDPMLNAKDYAPCLDSDDESDSSKPPSSKRFVPWLVP